ncbi:MAG: hypothetical protein EWM72_02004 [Nitrospira sp.]|nr:MAG: hypothetical protein EWM72_02004 [Nitrospira sp.]
MKMSTVWGGNKGARKRKRPVQKLKIRWDVLGLHDASKDGPSRSIDDIRRQVTSLASQGFGPETTSRSSTKDASTYSATKSAKPSAKRRRGATK